MKKILAPIALFLLLATSCKKEEPNNNVTIPTYKTYSSIDEIFNELSLKPKVVSIDAATGATFYGNSGTRYIFQPNCFIDETGAIVTGSVQIEVTEWLNKGDMIFSGVLPISNGESLISAGEIYVKIRKGGKQLFIKPGMTYQAKIPQFGSKDTVMSLFRGDINEGTITNKVNWRLKNDSAAIVRISYNNDSISIFPDSSEFHNADKYFYENSHNWQSFKVTIIAGETTIPPADLNTYALYDGSNGVYKLNVRSENIYQEDYLADIPVHFVSFCLINGHFYGGVQAAKPKTGQNYTISLKEVDPKEFKAQLALYP